MAVRPSLRKRLLLGVLAYVALLSIAVVVQGMVVNEAAERIVWRTMMNAELDHLRERTENDPEYRWADTRSMALHDSRVPGSITPELAALAPGLHDDILVGGRMSVALVRQEADHRLVLVLDLAAFEGSEHEMNLLIAIPALVLLVVLGMLTAWMVNRLARPLARMAGEIGALRPDVQGQRLRVPDDGTAELDVIGEAINDYLSRNDRFVERERMFVNMASHELRTPIAVIAGASELALRGQGMPDSTRAQVERIRAAARGVEELIGLLLVLAKDPERLRQAEERVALDAMLPAIVEDHRHLAEGKDLSIALEADAPAEIAAPPLIVQAAIGNLLRNAIENSDRGVVHVRVQAPGTVVIRDPGHGMSPAEIGALYSRMARGGDGPVGSGIGLDLIARLCAHLGWSLDIASGEGGGTTATLRFKTAASAA